MNKPQNFYTNKIITRLRNLRYDTSKSEQNETKLIIFVYKDSKSVYYLY